MATTQYIIISFFLLSCCYTLTHATLEPQDTKFGNPIDPKIFVLDKLPNLTTHFRFYWQDIVQGPNSTSIPIGPPLPKFNFTAPPLPTINFTTPPLPTFNSTAPPLPTLNTTPPPLPTFNTTPPPLPTFNTTPPPLPKFNNTSLFGSIRVIDGSLTIGPESTSTEVGRTQGISVSASKTGVDLILIQTFVFLEGEYSGSTITISGRKAASDTVSEIPVIGGSGVFRFAKGYVEARTVVSDPITGDSTVQYDVYVAYF